VVLACTHYPLLEAHFRAVLPPDITIVDPARKHAERAGRLVADLGIAPGTGATLCTTSGNVEQFRGNLKMLIGDLNPRVTAALENEGVGAGAELARESAGG
jgi:glutamate racemase